MRGEEHKRSIIDARKTHNRIVCELCEAINTKLKVAGRRECSMSEL